MMPPVGPPPSASPLPVLVPLSDEEEKQANKLYLDMFYKDYQSIRTYVDDSVSGFWKSWTPAERLALYQKHEPVFTDNMLQIEAWLTQAYAGNPDVGLLLSPYWAAIYAHRRLECRRMLRDYATILKGQERRVNSNGAARPL